MSDENLRKRLLFQCQHMGLKENDVLYGGFARAHMAALSAEELEQFDALLGQNDRDLMNWALASEDAPKPFNTPLLKRIQNFNKEK